MIVIAATFSQISLVHYLIVGALLLVTGLMCILLKRNAIGILFGVELVLNAANVNLAAFNRYIALRPDGKIVLDGQIFALFVIVLAAAEAAVALAIFLNFYNSHSSVNVEAGDGLREM